MKKLLYILLIVNCSLPIVNSQWFQLPNLPVSGTVYDMYFVNANTGWITLISPFNIIKTTNGGINWAVQGSMNIRDIQFLDSLTGYGNGFVGTIGTIWKTTNGGVNWTSLAVTGDNYADISFISKDTGWVCGDNGNSMLRIWRTTDGGVSFQEQYNTGGGSFTHIFMLKERVNGEYWGWSIVGLGFYRTTNSGVNWNQITTNLSGFCGSIYDMFFVDTLNGMLVRGNDCLNKTTNGGFNWSVINEGNIGTGSRLSMGDKNVGWVTLAADTIIKTINFFQTYGKQLIPAYASKVFASDTSVVYGGANEVNMIKTTNGGGNMVGIELINNQIPDKFTLSQNYPNPFNPETRIKFSLSKNSFVSMKLYDILGREVVEIYNNKYLNVGVYELTLDLGSTNLSSGIYFYRFIVFDSEGIILFNESKKLTYLK